MMGLLDLFRRPGTDEGVREFLTTPGAVLLDVRTPAEFGEGHIEGSLNFPLDRIESLPERVADRNAPIFVYCRSGARSARAAAALRQMGYRQVKNIGGIADYHGKVVH